MSYTIANKITNPDNGQSCYPDLCYTENYKEGELVDREAYKKAKALLDEEGASSFTCSFSDTDVRFDIKPQEKDPMAQIEEEMTHAYEEKIASTKSMRIELVNLIHFCLTKDDSKDFKGSKELLKKVLSDMEKLNLVPCTDKRQAKKCFSYMKKAFMEYEGAKNTPVCGMDRSVFSHVYVEKDIKDNPETLRILKNIKEAEIIYIDDCKDIFFRKNQDITWQQENKALILARQHAKLLYKGAPVCQSFGNEHFYYTSCVKNCIYDCEYCYLKGMYPSGHMVVYVDLERVFAEVKEVLKEHPVYLCISYDTDLLALEGVLHFVSRWIDFVEENENLTIEVRTKSANANLFKSLKRSDRVVYAFTLSPDEIAKRYEKYAPGFEARLDAIKTAIEESHRVRLCFDPLIYVPGWEKIYKNMLNKVWESVDPAFINDVSTGGFRISASYLKKMRKADKTSSLAWFPYENKDGYYQYDRDLAGNMLATFTKWLAEKIEENKIFVGY